MFRHMLRTARAWLQGATGKAAPGGDEGLPAGKTPASGLATPDGNGLTGAAEGPGSAPGEMEDDEAVTWTLLPGDSLWGLALRFYGEGAQWTRILEANTSRLTDPDDLPVGESLLLPGVRGAAPVAVAQPGLEPDELPSQPSGGTDQPAEL
jgi:nucleoid-associated protein YgaU